MADITDGLAPAQSVRLIYTSLYPAFEQAFMSWTRSPHCIFGCRVHAQTIRNAFGGFPCIKIQPTSGSRVSTLGRRPRRQSTRVPARSRLFLTRLSSLTMLLICAIGARAVMAVASLLPGTLPLGLGRLDPPGFGLKAYRWRKYGFPLKLFREVNECLGKRLS